MMAFISVVLPTPLRPTMATISPGSMDRLTSRTIMVRPYPVVTCETSSIDDMAWWPVISNAARRRPYHVAHEVSF